VKPRHRQFKVPIGPDADPLMWRWQILRIGRLPRIFVHKFLRSDYDRALHNHPWAFVSVLLKGEYFEHTENGVIHRRAPSVVYRPITHRHRVELIEDRPCWTLFLTGPECQRWGFFCQEGYVDSQQFHEQGGCA
jgi:hypothetical protein